MGSVVEYTVLIVLLFVLIAIVATVVAWFFWRASKTEFARYTQIKDERNEWRQKYEEAQEAYGEAKIESTQMTERAEAAQKNAEKSQTENSQLQQKTVQDAARIAELKTELQNAQTQADEKIAILEKAQKEMSKEFEKTGHAMEAQFKTLSQNILEEKSKKLREERERFGKDSEQLLKPLRDNISEFRQRIDAIHDEETKERSTLKSDIANLQKNAVQVGKEADNLARALKGDKKMQGNWGESTLKRILEISGLREGQDYETQSARQDEDNHRLIPDIIINLPDNKHLIIDSKVSLNAYVDYVNVTDEVAESVALQKHCAAVRQHMKILSKRRYQHSRNINSPDFVLMFMPIEPAYIAAVASDVNLLLDAWSKKIIICAPSTLMPIMRTVSSMWQLESQNKNAEEIARQGGALYDKFILFLESMEDINKALDKARESYDTAFNRIKSGKGNLIGQAKKLHKLGIPTKPTKLTKKRLPIIDGSDDEK